MGSPLAWQNLLFHIPLCAGLLLLVGAATLGLADGHGDTGADHDHDHDHDQDHAATPGGSAPAPSTSMPLLLRVSTLLLLFGGTGVGCHQLRGGTTPWLSAPVALATALLLTPLIGRLLRRWLPGVETYRISRRDLIGRTGLLVLPAGPDRGLLQLRDREGNLHQVLCRTTGPSLPTGEEVLVLEEDPATSVFTVEPCPPEARTATRPPFLES